MEMQLFILGHVILYPICMIAVMTAPLTVHPLFQTAEAIPVDHWKLTFGYRWKLTFGLATVLFIVLEIVYWVLHFIFV